MDTSRLSQGEKIVAVCSGLLVLFSFFPLWAKYEYDVGIESGTERGSAWSDAFNFTSKLAILLAITALVLVALKAFGTDVKIPASTGLIYVGLGGLSSLLLLLLLVMGPEDGGISSAQAEALGLEVSRGIMMFVGLVLAIGILIGGYMHMQSETDEPAAPTTPPPPVS